AVRRVWKERFGSDPKLEVFNGQVVGRNRTSAQTFRARLLATTNSDPNTFDRTLVTVRQGKDVFTFKVDDLAQGPLFLPHLGVAVLADDDNRDYAALAAEQQARGAKTLYNRVAEMP